MDQFLSRAQGAACDPSSTLQVQVLRLGAVSPLSKVKQPVRHGVGHTQATETGFFVCMYGVPSHILQAGSKFTMHLKLTLDL